jgi:enterochelin esterase-like enzyme
VQPGKVAVMGSSMGGLASLNALLLRPDVFNRAGCVSTHWPIRDPKPEEAPDISAAITGYLDAHLGKPMGRKLWFDHGDQTLDQFYAPFQIVADAHVAAHGWQSPRDTVSRAYPGAAHNEASWRARVADPLTFLFKQA